MTDIKFPDEFQLTRTEHYFEREDDPAAVAYCLARNELYRRAQVGAVYIKFIDGDRKGSIARLTIDPKYNQKLAEIRRRPTYYSSDKTAYEIDWYFFSGIAKFDKPKRSCQVSLPEASVIFLPNYTGPTVYQLFDRKAAKQKLLVDPDQRDIDGEILAIGDKVLYINTRYGSGSELCHGTIKEFKVTADSKGHSYTTIVQNDEADEESSMSYPFQMIWRK